MKKHGKIILIVGLSLIILAACLVWFANTHVALNGDIISVSAAEVVLEGETLPDLEALKQIEKMETLDVRGIPIQPEQYEQLRSAFPGCRILWRVPVFGAAYDNAETKLVTAEVSDQDIENLAFFPELKTVDATRCADYDRLLILKEAYPEVEVTYEVSVGEKAVRENVTEVTVGGDDASALMAAIPYLPKLQKIDALACSDYDMLFRIKAAYPALEVQYTLPVCDNAWPSDTTQLTLHNADGEELQQMLPYFAKLTTVTLTGTNPDHELIYEMMCRYPDVVFDWSFSVHGVVTSSTATELILSDIQLDTVEEVENALKYFYDLQRVEMCQCGISSEEMDALGKRHPEIRFVWSIPMGKGYLRTDATAFIPYKFGFDFAGPCNDTQTRELKYCVDMVCLDLGHMRMKDLSFLKYMPKLKYLILADTQAKDYSPVAGLTELIFLELFNSDFKDTELLLNLTKLEDLNISWTSLKNPQQLKQMTWLKRLWATRIGLPDSENPKLKEALPDTQVYTHGKHPTEGGWRQSQNYYDMRDLLGMGYMD